MGWFGSFLKSIAHGVAGSPPVELIFVPSVRVAADGKIPGVGEPIEPDCCYVELYLESMRLTRARKFATRFHGLAYSFVTLPREGESHAQLTAVSKPEKLAELDKNSLDKVITVSKQMMGSTPFRGGPVSLEFGLFSVKSGNLLSPILDYVTKVSETAGISYVGAIKPFVPLITGGMDLIAGQVNDTALEVGVDTDLNVTTSFVSAMIARPKGTIDEERLSLDKDRRLLLNGDPLDCGYATFSLRRSMQKADYGEIPELKERYGAVHAAIKSGKEKDARDALTAFRLAAIASPDLITSDAKRLVAKVREKVDEAFPQGGGFAGMRPEIAEELSAVGLYEPELVL